MTTMDIYEQHEAAFADIGYRPSTAATCPRVVAGKRCQAGRDLDDYDPCICWTFAHILDHGRIWLDREGRHILTSEPYEFDDEEVTRFLAALQALGLEAHFSGRALWHLAAILITVKRPR